MTETIRLRKGAQFIVMVDGVVLFDHKIKCNCIMSPIGFFSTDTDFAVPK